MLSFFISAGENSGNLHASELMKRIKQVYGNNVTFAGLGGDEMKSLDMEVLYHVKELSAVGYTEVIRKYPFFRKVLSESSEFIIQRNPSAVILVDYPGFNLRLAEKIRPHYKGKIIYYISPQLWAWGSGRVELIRKYIDKILIVFPFEKEFYGNYGINAQYVGHPLVEKLKNYRHEIKTKSNEIKITLMPASRKEELKHHLPVLYETLRELQKEFKIKITILRPDYLNESLYKIISDKIPLHITSENKYQHITDSDMVLTKAGTSSLECALIGVPHLIFYKTGLINYVFLKPRVKINSMGIANIIAGENIISEFIQKDFTCHNLKNEAVKIISDEEYVKTMKENLAKVREILGDSDASLSAAQEILKFLQ